MYTILNDCKIAKYYRLDNYKLILNNRIQFYLDFNWKECYEKTFDLMRRDFDGSSA